MRIPVRTDNAPQPLGPYSQAIIADGVIFVAAQVPLDPKTGKMPKDAAAQMEQVLKNVRAVLEAAGAALVDVVKCTLYLADKSDGPAVNEVYARYFQTDPPARTTLVAATPTDAKVALDCVAILRQMRR